MHHLIFPYADTYLTNRPKELDTRNFGVDEILQVGTNTSLVGYISDTTSYTYINQYFQNYSAQDYTGIFTGSISPGTASFVGSLVGVTGCLTGTGSGVDVRLQRSRQYYTASYKDRALLQFDLMEISRSIVAGDIVNPSFHLKVKICNEYQLPVEYSIFVAPISESWEMGNGYASDGGSEEGASWIYRDYYNGTPWATTGSSFIPTYVTQSFRYKSADINVDVTSIVNQWLAGLPNYGFLVMSSDEFHPTGSGFLLKYFSEDTNTIYSPVLDVGWSNDWEFVTGSCTTSSVVISYSSGSNTTIAPSSSLWGAGGIHGNFKGAALVNITSSITGSLVGWDGFLSCSGFTGNINGIPVIGAAYGLLDTSSVAVILPTEIKYCVATSPMESPYGTPNFPPTSNPHTYLNLEWVWGGDEVGWSSLIPIPPNAILTSSCGVSHSVELMTGQFTNGPFSSSTFNAYYENYQILFANLTGSWTIEALIGTSIFVPLPQSSYPYVTAYIQGPYVTGRALGYYMTSSLYSASFNGQFVSGPLMGAYCAFQLTGSATTTTYYYTSSVNFTSSLLYPLNVERPFSINIGNMQPEYKAGDIIKINVFGRKKFPLKYFGISTQQEQYLIPEFLPLSSYYALKDNQTDEIVINFDPFTKISCEYPGGNYFFIDTTGLPQERYYRVLIRIEDDSMIDTIDTGKTFKITR